MGDYDMYLILTVTKFENIFNFSGLLWREGNGSEVPVVFYRQYTCALWTNEEVF
jgi:hypothetical protein